MKALRFLSLVILLLVTGCSPKTVNLTGADNGSSVTLRPSQELVIALESNPTTGYSWQVAEVDPAILAQVGESEYKQSAGSEGLVGVGGTETLRFEAVAAGEVTLTLGYARPWETDVLPIETFVVTVVVE